MTGDLDQVLKRIADEVAADNPGLVFVDSFRSVVSASESGAVRAPACNCSSSNWAC